jgi:hypothetical protein
VESIPNGTIRGAGRDWDRQRCAFDASADDFAGHMELKGGSQIESLNPREKVTAVIFGAFLEIGEVLKRLLVRNTDILEPDLEW